MEDSIELVVSGKSFPNIKKDALKEKSGYFKALLSESFKDSNETSYKFNGWSTKAFEILIQFVTTGTVDIRARNAKVLRSALEIANYLMMEEFRPQLCRKLITSWSDMRTNDALELAEELGIKRSLEEYSVYKVLADVERQHYQSNYNYDVLIMATSVECFWVVAPKEVQIVEYVCGEFFDARWVKVLERYEDVLRLAMKLPCHAKKVRALAQNMQLHILDGRVRPHIWNLLCPSSAVTKLLEDAFEDSLVEARQNCREILSYIRIPVVSGPTVKTFCVTEFDANYWLWGGDQCHHEFTCNHCIVMKDYATFLGETGLLIYRMGREPVIIKNDSIGEVMGNRPFDYKSLCINGKHLFILDLRLGEPSKMYQFNFCTNEFFECSEVLVQKAILKAHGDVLYIIGYTSVEEKFCVLEYNIHSKETSIIVVSDRIHFTIKAAVVLKNKICVLSLDSFTIVDTMKKEDQPLEVKNFVGLVRKRFHFLSILDVAPKDQDVLMNLCL